MLAAEVNKIISEADDSFSLEMLAEMGGSSGGARPKVLINIQEEPWIVKFPSSYDQANFGSIENNYSLVAKKCGIDMPEIALLEKKHFGVRRFDRHGIKRIHMHTAACLLYVSHRYPSLDYIDLIKGPQNIEEAKQCGLEL